MENYDPDIPLFINKLHALQRRLPINYGIHQEIKQDIFHYTAGFNGEKSLIYHLRNLEKNEYVVVGNVRLRGQHGYYFQIDNLIVTPTFLLILEAKNISGEIIFDRIHNQLIRTLNGVNAAFSDPILQIKDQEFELRKWLAHHKSPHIPIISKVVITNPSTIIKMVPPNSKDLKYVIRSKMLAATVQTCKNMYKEVVLTNKEMKKLNSLIKKHHTPYNPEILERYKVTSSDVIAGVQCPTCFNIPMRRIRGSWKCQNCSAVSSTAHINAMIDYYLLFKSNMTNVELRNFLKITSPTISLKLIKALNLPHEGSAKSRTYTLSLPLLEKQLPQ